MKKLFKIILVLFLSVCILIGVAISCLIYFQDSIIRNFIESTNKELNTKVSIDKIELNYLRSFPQIGLLLKGIKVKESIPDSEKLLLEAEQMVLAFDAWQMLGGEYELHHLILKNATVIMRNDKKGRPNFKIFSDSEDSQRLLSFKMSAVRLINVNYTYDLGNSEDHYSGNFKDMKARFHWKDGNAKTNLSGSLNVLDITVNSINYVKNRETYIETEFYWKKVNKELEFQESDLKVGNSKFRIQGSYTFSDQPAIDISVSELKSDLNDVLLFIPEKFATPLYPYQINGDWQFHLTVKGPMGKSDPSIDIKFSVKKGSFYQPDLKLEIGIQSLEGTYSNGSKKNLSTSSIHVPSFSAKLKNGGLSGKFSLIDFNNPFLNGDLKGSLTLSDLVELFDIKQLIEPQGDLKVNLTLNGYWKEYISRNSSMISGDAEITNLSFRLPDYSHKIDRINGDLIFNNSDIAMSNVTAEIGESDFKVYGIIKDVLIRDENNRWAIKARVESKRINLDQLIVSSKNEEESFAWPQNLSISLDCKVGEIKYKKWGILNLEGKVGLNHKMMGFQDVSGNIAQGNLEISGMIENGENYRADIQFKAKQTLIDSLFYLSDNFSQTFISSENLSGFLDGQLDLQFEMDKKLVAIPSSIVADADLTIQQGQLRNFEPMQSLSRFAKEDELAFVRFSELRNKIHIENERVYVPEMTIRSSIRELAVIGVHDFDQRFEYRVKLPVFKKGKIPDEAADAVEDDGKGGLFIYLIIAGTPDNFKVSYDKIAVKGKIKEGWKKEKEELKKAFTDKRTDKKEEKKVEVNEEEFFDFD